LIETPKGNLKLAPDAFLVNSKHAPSIDCDSCKLDGLLPVGIEKVGDAGIAATRLLPNRDDCPAPSPQNPITIAVFDFDGTCINGSSPMRLVNVLIKHRKLNPYKMLRLLMWGAAYKLNLPKDAEGVRTRVFSAFEGFPAKTVNQFLCRFYNKQVAPHYRKDADAVMQAHLDMGHVVVLVSASFEPIVAAAMVDHPIQYALASRMKIDDMGNYTDEVDGLPTEGPDKVVVFKTFANQVFGEGCWKVGFAYADHYSDLDILSEAENPCAVTPDAKLKHTAKSRGWCILDWQ
jgi:HAD superfamily hydrolase (TIGR01490 family)